MEWKLKAFDKLTGLEVYRILQNRVNVFMLEQNCLYPEVDNKDLASHHLFLETDNGEIAAYCRLLPQGVSYPQASIGRVIVNQAYRGQGLARDLMSMAISYITEVWGEREIKIQAQHYLEHFYGSFGFKGISDVYLEDDIPHVDMLLRVEETGAAE